ncbi:hypothetical protein IFM89_017056 [Coptis chinensis]|uniref:NAC domain-containing protein n=1 Tax=Coptis chinensis TaxID=261450 RepID=A0A835LVN0_9MAGN|nr:hypothetical protein IFM89_017056 [Coptis chinensis]
MEKTTSSPTTESSEVAEVNSIDADEEFLQSFPLGYRFAPRDDELIEHYLMNKLSNRKLPINNIKDVNIYKHNPQDFTDLYKTYGGDGEKEWYFFTPRDRKYPNGSRPNRAAGNGYWKATGADRDITTNTKDAKKIIGKRKVLVFYVGKSPKGAKTKWIMHEYRVDDEIPRSRAGLHDRVDDEIPRSRAGLHDMRLDDWVLCRIYLKVDKCASKVSRKRKCQKVDKAASKVSRKKEGERVDKVASKVSRKRKGDNLIEVPSIDVAYNSNPASTPESNGNLMSSFDSGKLEPIFDEDGRYHILTMCEALGFDAPSTHSYSYLSEYRTDLSHDFFMEANYTVQSGSPPQSEARNNVKDNTYGIKADDFDRIWPE